MNGVIAEHVGRGDILLHRGFDERVGVRWEQDDGTGLKPVDLTGWTGRFELLSPGDMLWYSQALGTGSFDVSGLAVADIPWTAFTSDVWAQRVSGGWRVTGISPDGSRRELLAHGYFNLA